MLIREFFPIFMNFNYITFSVFFFFFLLDAARSVDSQFEACKTDLNCGSGPNINYPFWIQGRQPPHCGYPGFNISCKNNKPILKVSSNEYVILEIMNQNQSLRVSSLQVSSINSSCVVPPLSHNLTFSQTPFKLGPAHADLFLFFNCSVSLSNIPARYVSYFIDCFAGSLNSVLLSLALFTDDQAFDYLTQLGKCKNLVIVPVDKSGNESIGSAVDRESNYIMKLMNKGFQLTWNASTCEVCVASGGRCGFDYSMYSFACFCSDRPHSKRCPATANSGQRKRIAVAVATSAFGIILISVVLIFCRQRKFLMLHNNPLLFWKRTKNAQMKQKLMQNSGPKRYRYSDVKRITDSFKEELGKGGYGKVFKGKICDGRFVAVKMLNESKGNGEDFMNEVESISRTSHKNVVSLLGYCIHRSERALVYEFMPKGSLDKYIYKGVSNTSHLLTLEKLYDIAVGIAEGLHYSHYKCNTRIVHFDIKPHNILLDIDFSPKISDFGLAKLCTRKDSVMSEIGARGTIGYIAPEMIWKNLGGVSHKSDVYSYGMMVLEMVGGRKNFVVRPDHTSTQYFPCWIYEHLDQQDEDVEGLGVTSQEAGEVAKKMTLVGLWCIQTNPTNRPSISKVLEMLKGSLDSLQIPPKPYLVPPSASPSN